MLRAIIFDLDNTLYNEELYFYSVLSSFSEKHGLSFVDLKQAYERELGNPCSDIFGNILKRINYYQDDHQIELFNLYKCIDTPLYLFPDALVALNIFQQEKIKTGIITNGTPSAQRNKVSCLGIKGKIDHITYARELGRDKEKPHPAPFEDALHNLQVKPFEALYIGDNPKIDIAGAASIGIPALLIQRPYIRPRGILTKDYYTMQKKITNFNEIIPLSRIEPNIQTNYTL